MRVLVVDDAPRLRPWLRDALATAFGSSDMVTTLDEGRAAVAVRNFELAVVDRGLPDGDGLALLDVMVRRTRCSSLREILEAAAYGLGDEIQSNVIDAHVSRLRRRLREANCKVAIRPVRELGYLLGRERWF